MVKKQNTSNVWGITSLIVSIISLIIILMPYFGLPLAIFSIVASRMQKPSTGPAVGGLVVGIISTILNAITFLIFLVALAIGL